MHGHVFTYRQKWIMVIKKEHGLVQEKRNALEEDRYAMECRIVTMVKMKTKICVQEIFVITDSKAMKQDYLFDYYRIPDYPSNQIDYYRTHETDLYREKMEEMIQKLEMGKCENSTKCRRER